MFERWNPLKGERLALLGPDGTLAVVPDGVPIPPDEKVLDAYKKMVITREADLWAVSLNRQGRLPTYPPSMGQEANSIGSALALKKDDWFVQAFREMGGLIMRDVPLNQQFLFWLGDENGSRLDPERYHIFPVSVPIASQVPHAVGLAWAERYKKTDRIAIVFVGDGGTSEGDFHEGLNFAGVWNAPVIVYIQNNQWAISVPRNKQTASPTLAQKAVAYGIEGVQIDGNDLFAVFAAVSMAAEKARSGGGPTLIEGFTYRLGAHTTSDDPTRYRENAEVEEWKGKDPLLRLELYLTKQKLLTAKKIEEIRNEANKNVKAAFDEAEKAAKSDLDDSFSYTYREMPPLLKRQLARRRAMESGEGE